MKVQRIVVLCSLVFLSFTSLAQIPAGYYDSALGLTAEPLRTALYNIIKNHIVINYSSLFSYFPSTDATATNTVWDIYSDIPSGVPAYTFTFVTNQCGSYSAEGDCFNREHSVPQSWFSGASPMYSDMFHIYPTDGYVNGKRSNYPYGEVTSPTWTSTNGSKLGNNTFSGYSGTVFEPINEYKGDIARSYFYMATMYKNVMSGWSSSMFVADNLSSWARSMLYIWSVNDPVSQKEIDRNNAIYAIQNNRNPYIDHPEWINEIWGPTAGIQEQQVPEFLMYYSNGAINFYGLTTEQGILTIYDASGRIVWQSENFVNKTIEISLTPGIYFCHFKGENHLLYAKFAVLQE